MSEIRVTSIVGENGGDRVGLTTGLTVGPLTGTTGIGATITHHGHAQFAGVCTATSFVGNGANLTGLSVNTNPLQVLEEFEVPCDGTAITTSKGSVSIGNVTTSINLTTSFQDLTGSSISYQPPDNTKIVIYSFNFAGFYANTSPICYGFIYLDDVPVSSHPFTERADHLIRRTTWSHAFRIEPSLSANAATGRVQSWNSAKTIKIKVRDHSNSYNSTVHNLSNSSNTAGSNVADSFVIPTIGIKAIGSV